jgi:hypothetical protein
MGSRFIYFLMDLPGIVLHPGAARIFSLTFSPGHDKDISFSAGCDIRAAGTLQIDRSDGVLPLSLTISPYIRPRQF